MIIPQGSEEILGGDGDGGGKLIYETPYAKVCEIWW